MYFAFLDDLLTILPRRLSLSEVATLRLGAGDLNVFKGKNTAHRVTPPVGELARVVTVFSYYEPPGRMFSDEENLGFYGRTVS
jgi:hypothetical protein